MERTDGAQVLFQGRSDTIQHRVATEFITSEVMTMEVICPACGCGEASHFYRHGNEIVGCEYCIRIMERYEIEEGAEDDTYDHEDYWGEG